VLACFIAKSCEKLPLNKQKVKKSFENVVYLMRFLCVSCDNEIKGVFDKNRFIIVVQM
jgi:hypothetical protein